MIKIEDRQQTEWGQVEWIKLPDESGSRMSVGLVTMLPHTRARRHIHYGQEQFLYVAEGEGTYYINDERHDFKPGSFFVMEADCSHETINDSDGVVQEILVSIPVGGRSVSGGRTESSFDGKVDAAEAELIYEAAGAISETVKDISNVPYTVFDINARPVLQGNGFPDICRENCDPVNNSKNCECFRKKFGECETEDGWISCTCSHGMKTFLCPVGYEGRLIGVVRGGHFFTSEKGAVNEAGSYDVPKTAQIAIHSVLEQIVESIEKYISYLSSVNDLKSKEKMLADSSIENENLMKNLIEVNEKVTNLKINHHFLFNTLNCMSAMALEGERRDVYQSIIDLSKMFRYTMTTEVKMTSLAQELDYLKSYLNLQKLRYKDGLSFTFDIAEECGQVMVPFNFLQPIVENAFTHGFMSYDYDKVVNISAGSDNEFIYIEMFNNGIVPSKAEMNRIMKRWSQGNGHGLSLIYDKLKACYADKFEMKMETAGEEGALITVKIPKK